MMFYMLQNGQQLHYEFKYVTYYDRRWYNRREIVLKRKNTINGAKNRGS